MIRRILKGSAALSTLVRGFRREPSGHLLGHTAERDAILGRYSNKRATQRCPALPLLSCPLDSPRVVDRQPL
jgi:hypothetical protein